jgi:cytochrome c-type biogenesis protein
MLAVIMPEFFSNDFNQFLLVNQANTSFFLMLIFALVGGLLSSLSPCVLSLLPLNLAYIGTLDIEDKKAAFNKAAAFVLGASLVMGLLGAFSNFAFAVFSEFRSILYLIVGVIILFMALMVLGLIKIPLPQLVTRMPKLPPLFIGMLFALISSPCSSPVLFGILSMASTAGSVISSVLIMFFYALGYTAIIFFASVSVGLMKQLNWFKSNSLVVTRISAAILISAGLFYIFLALSRGF